MKTETIEWFTPEEKKPEDDVELIVFAVHPETGFYFVMEAAFYGHDEKFETLCGVFVVPEYWAYAPKGPQ